MTFGLLSSVISVTRPLDYEQVPNGLIHLTVMAKDGGNPALNSTVPVTVEVVVSVITHTHTHTDPNVAGLCCVGGHVM